MTAGKKNKLQWIRGLMLFSQGLLLLFTVQWLISQYNEQQSRLRSDLTQLFTNVQQRIADSLLLEHVIKPGYSNLALPPRDTVAEAAGPLVALSPQGLHKVLTGASKISKPEADRLFSMDTMAFNELFVDEMKQNGWNFNSTWVNNSDSDKEAKSTIFIKSDFFTTDNGVIVSDYNAYLMRRLTTPFIFALILLSLTATAFLVTYKSLKSQIKLGELKDDFISNMSHELKTPIATVKVTLEALSNYDVIDNPTLSREYLGMATSEMERLELLATRVLNTSLLENGNISLQRETVNLKELVAGLVQTMQARLAQHNATIAFTATGHNFDIPLDRLHIQGVLVNLIDNSLKYGVQPVHVAITLQEVEGRLQLALTDNGPGIPEEYTEKIFDKFFRVPAGNRHNTKGHGLGLNYARQIMNLHNGKIAVANVNEGGCVFTLSF